MQDQQTPKDTPPESPYAPVANLIVEICSNEDFSLRETIRRFWGKYTLPDTTLLLYQLLMAGKAGAGHPKGQPNKGQLPDGRPSTPLPHYPDQETLDTFFRDLCEAITAFSYMTKFKHTSIVIVKPKTPEPDGRA